MSRAAETLIALLIVGLLAPTTVSAESKPMSPYDVTRLVTVGSVAIAPDGQRVAYTVWVQREPFADPDGPAWSHLYVVDATGTSRPYVTGRLRVRAPRWTPDGAGITFLSKREGDTHTALWVIPIDGGEAERLYTHDGAAISAYSLSPDGTRVAYLATDKADNGAGTARSRGFDYEVYEEHLAYSRVYVARLTGDDAAEEGASAPRRMTVEGSASAVRWSPKGDRLAITAAPTPLTDDRYMRSQVHLVDVASGKTLGQVETTGKIGQAAWSTDGRKIAVVAAVDQHDPEAGRIVVADGVRGGRGKLLLEDLDGHVTALAWRDSNTILYVAERGTGTRVGQLRADGSRPKTIADSPHGARGLSLAADGKTYALGMHTPVHPLEVFRGVVGAEDATRLSDSNPWLLAITMATQEVVRWRDRDDELELEGILIRPLEEVAGQRYPLIVHVHGGPEAHVSHGWITSYGLLGQVAAARGFAVFYPNYRGSTGRGVAFSKLGQADAAGKEFDDLVDGVDHLIAAGLADKDRVGISGGSYGGYAAAWAATKLTDRFAAAVMFVGISDKISKTGTTDIPGEEYLVHTRKRVWDDWQWFLERSPIFHVRQARTPLLIAHGKDDPRVHPQQALELYRQLRVLAQSPVRLVFYPGEGHGNRRAASRLDYNLRHLRWMEHYLLGKGGDPPPMSLEYEKVWRRFVPTWAGSPN